MNPYVIAGCVVAGVAVVTLVMSCLIVAKRADQLMADLAAADRWCTGCPDGVAVIDSRLCRRCIAAAN